MNLNLSLIVKQVILTFRKSIPLGPMSFVTFLSRGMIFCGSGMVTPTKKLLVFKIWRCLGIRSPVMIHIIKDKLKLDFDFR
jgi:hypothetical protein